MNKLRYLQYSRLKTHRDTMTWKGLSKLLVLYEGNLSSPVLHSPHKRPAMQSFYDLFAVNLNKLLKKSSQVGIHLSCSDIYMSSM